MLSISIKLLRPGEKLNFPSGNLPVSINLCVGIVILGSGVRLFQGNVLAPSIEKYG